MIHQPPSIMSDVRLSAKTAAIPIVRSRSCNPYRSGGRLSPQPFPAANTGNNRDNNNTGSIDRDDDVLSPLPGDNEDTSAASSPSVLSRSPGMRLGVHSPGIRRRSNTLDSAANFAAANRKAAAANSQSGFVPLPVKVPKDPIQPKQGSIQDIHSSVRDNEEDEEDDVFSELISMRPRSSTCPANMAKLRKVKLRSMRRPPTPPPMDLIDSHSHSRTHTPLAHSHSSSLDEIEDEDSIDEPEVPVTSRGSHSNCVKVPSPR